MAYSLNRAQIIGNLTRDPEVKTTPGGQQVGTFGVATNFSWTDQSGQKKEKTEFHNVVVWRKLAEICEKYLKKGMKVYIEGRMQTRDWEGEDGVKRYRTEIVADNMIMLSGKGSPSSGNASDGSFPEERAPRSVREKPSAQESGAPVAQPEEEVSLDDLPF